MPATLAMSSVSLVGGLLLVDAWVARPGTPPLSIEPEIKDLPGTEGRRQVMSIQSSFLQRGKEGCHNPIFGRCLRDRSRSAKENTAV